MTTTPGEVYEISFAYLAENGTPNSFTANFGGKTLFSITNDTSNTTNPATWSYKTFQASATGNTTVLSFTSYNNPAYDALDAVSVTALPEPSSLVLYSSFAAVAIFYVARRGKFASTSAST